MLRSLVVLLLCGWSLAAQGPVYVSLWFDTEDYIEPAADDAALRLASDLTALGVRGTFKIVGEKARVLEARKRTDVIQALAKHGIGYHSNWHSVHPTPSEYLRPFGYLEGADEFERRERRGAADVKRIFGVSPACYGQPGNSWGPQSNLALRRMGIPVYLDDGDQVGLDGQPFWYGGLLYIFNMGPNTFRADLKAGTEDKVAYAKFDRTAERLAASGGGVISIVYHPTEFVTTEFWDGVNFSNGANPERSQWKAPNRRTPADSERCYGIFRHFVEHMKSRPGVRFVTAADLLEIYKERQPASGDRRRIAEHLSRGITFLDQGSYALSPADMLLQLLGLPAGVVDGPTARGVTTVRDTAIPRAAFEHASKDAADFIARNKRLPNQVFIGADTLSLPDFTATLAASVLENGPSVPVRKGDIQFERYFSTEPRNSFDWVIHRDNFAAPELLELGRLQGWTLKPAKLGTRQ